MLNTSLLLEPVQTPEVMSAKLLLPEAAAMTPLAPGEPINCWPHC